jgi:hypothetical protein
MQTKKVRVYPPELRYLIRRSRQTKPAKPMAAVVREVIAEAEAAKKQ